MILSYYDVKYDFENDEDPVKTYEVTCFNCGSGKLFDLNYDSENIDGYECVELTLECEVCGQKFIETGVELDIYSY